MKCVEDNGMRARVLSRVLLEKCLAPGFSLGFGSGSV